MAKLTIDDVKLSGKRVLIRVDYNVPLDPDRNVADDLRITATLPTLNKVLAEGARVILMSHLGRPKGKVVEELRMKPVAERLQELVGRRVVASRDIVGPPVVEAFEQLGEGDLLLLENLRFHPGEKANDYEFARELASLADVYINDAFGACHREHASIAGVPRFLPAAAGYLLKKEIEYLSVLLETPARPFVAIMGGAKVSDKIGVVENLLPKLDCILVGGAMSYTFLRAKGLDIGSSRLEEEKVELAREILERAGSLGKDIVLPVDHAVARSLEAGAENRTVEGGIEEGWMGLDIGPKTEELFVEKLSGARTVVWNGPLGVFETPPFDRGSRTVAAFLANLDGTVVIGGGDTAGAVREFDLGEKMTHVSTGGGACLEFLEGRKLPGIEALTDK
jgi:3-phosphoglycerate kinase